MNKNQKESFRVLLFAADFFSRASLNVLSDEELMLTAAENPLTSTIYDSLNEFQEAFNDEQVDEVNNFIYFVKNLPTTAFSDRVLEEVKESYKKDGICMADLLAETVVDDLTIEQGFELYIKAKQWADGDKFYIQRAEGKPELLVP